MKNPAVQAMHRELQQQGRDNDQMELQVQQQRVDEIKELTLRVARDQQIILVVSGGIWGWVFSEAAGGFQWPVKVMISTIPGLISGFLVYRAWVYGYWVDRNATFLRDKIEKHHRKSARWETVIDDEYNKEIWRTTQFLIEGLNLNSAIFILILNAFAGILFFFYGALIK